MTYQELFHLFCLKYGKDKNVIFFTFLFYLSKQIKSKDIFVVYRNRSINFSINKFNHLCKQYFIYKKPIYHITKYFYFIGYKFILLPKVLAPRDITMNMVNNFIKYIKKLSQSQSIYDLCCGSGFIGLSIKKTSQQHNVTLVDKYASPINNTRLNAQKLNLNVKIIKSDVNKYLQSLKNADFIIANPPYIDPDDHSIDHSILKWEAKSALIAKNKGLYFYGIFFKWLSSHYFKQCWLEFGYDQKKQLSFLIEKYKNLKITFFEQYVIVTKK